MDSTPLTTRSVGRVVVVGSGGRLGSALLRKYQDRYEVFGFNHKELDLGKPEDVRQRIEALEFDTLINVAAFTNVDVCEKEREWAFRINAEAPRILAEICRRKDAKLIHFSTDYVFDGSKREPYIETDQADPISVYAESKLAGEELVLQTDARALVVRVSWIFGPDRPSFVDGMIAAARENERISAVADKFSTPTFTHDVAEMLEQFFDAGSAGRVDGLRRLRTPQLAPGRVGPTGEHGVPSETDHSGILHFTSSGSCSWQEYAQYAIDCCHQLGVPLKARSVAPHKLRDMENFVARRPPYTVLSTAKYTAMTGRSPRHWRDAVADYVRAFVAR